MDLGVLARVNQERAKRGLNPLRNSEAHALIERRRSADDYKRDETLDFLISYVSGIPMPSSGGIIGATLHSAEATASTPHVYDGKAMTSQEEATKKSTDFLSGFAAGQAVAPPATDAGGSSSPSSSGSDSGSSSSGGDGGGGGQ